MAKPASNVSIVAKFLVAFNSHAKAVNGLSGWTEEEIRKILADAKAKSEALFTFLVFSLLSGRNGGIRYHNRNPAWLDLLPQNCLSDFCADALLFVQMLELLKISTSADISRVCSERTLQPELFSKLERWNFNMPAVVQCLTELQALHQQGVALKTPNLREMNQQDFTKIIASALWSKYQASFHVAETNVAIKNILTRDRIEIRRSCVSGNIKDDELVLFEPVTEACIIVAGCVKALDIRSACQADEMLSKIKEWIGFDPEFYTLNFDDMSSLCKEQEKELPTTASTAQSVQVPIELLEVPSVPDSLLVAVAPAIGQIEKINAILQAAREQEMREEKLSSLREEEGACTRSISDLEEKIAELGAKLKEELEKHQALRLQIEALSSQGVDNTEVANLKKRGEEIIRTIQSMIQLANTFAA